MDFAPLYRHRPASKWTNGDIAAKVGADLGLPPDDEQRWILDTIFAEKAPGRPAAFEFAVVGPRQNIKTSTVGVASLTELFVPALGVQRQVWSSHLVDTSKATFNDFKTWIGSNHEYAELVDYYEGHQDLSIYRLDDPDCKIDFRSRTGKSSRGLTGVKRVILDEALYLEPKHVGAVYPTMLTRPGAQVRAMSSAGLLTSAQLRAIRDRGRKGNDPRLAYLEYGAKRRACEQRGCLHIVGTPGCALDDRELWWQANCALWSSRISEESLENMRNSMPPAEFMREFFSWWEDPESEGGAVSLARWLDLKDPGAERGDVVVFGLDLTGERDVWVAVAWVREDGHTQVMLANDGAPIPSRLAARECERLQETWGAPFATSALGDELEKADLDVIDVTGPDFATATGLFIDGITGGTIHHGNQPALNEAVKIAQLRPELQNGERALLLRGMPEVGPAAAVVRALHGLTNLDTDTWGFFS